MKQNGCGTDLRYFRLPEVAQRLGLGQVRKPRCGLAAGKVISEEERLARAVRRLVEKGLLKAVKDQGTWLVREDWIEEYEALRMIRALRTGPDHGGPVEWPRQTAAIPKETGSPSSG